MTDIEIRDVNIFLDNYKKHYEYLLNQLESKFNGYAQLAGFTNAIYRVYSRGHKQQGNIFKSPWKIQDKINKMRSGYTDLSGTKISAKPEYYFSDLSDIIGLTIVCVYLSDAHQVRDLIKQDVISGSLVSKMPFDKKTNQCCYEIRDGGYYAYHYTLRMPNLENRGGPNLKTELWCEVQVKTVLHDAWASKTHDLSYKPYAELDDRIRSQFAHLGDTLAAIDRQSEVIKELVFEKWREDDEYKNLSRRSMIETLARNIESYESTYRERVSEIISDMNDNRRLLRAQPITDGDVKSMIEKIDSLCADKRANFDSCSLFAALACLRREADLLDATLDRVIQWFLTESKDHQKVRALMFKGLVMFTFGQSEEAIKTTEMAWEDCKTKIAKIADDIEKYESMMLDMSNNLAYYYADLCGTEVGRKLKAPKKAEYHIKYARTLQKKLGIPHLGVSDTEGAVLIHCETNPTRVRDGLKLCHEALEAVPKESPLHPMAEAFYHLHERQAFRKLLKLEVADV